MRDDFLEILALYDESNLIYVDEVGFNVTLRIRTGRSFRGTREVHVVAGLRSRNVSVCCAISKTGIINFQVQTIPYNTETFTASINTLLEPIANRGPSVIIMDNVPFHKARQIRGIIESRSHLLLSLPPYSPFLIPIENMFVIWKQSIRQSRPLDEEDLIKLINNVDNVTSPDDCALYYRHMFRFIPRCNNREAIVDE